MVEKETYLVVAAPKREVLLRRCAIEGDRDDCEVAWLVNGRIQATYPATTLRARVPTALVHKQAEPIAARIKKMKGHVLNVRQREVAKGELYGPERGSVYRFELSGDRLQIVYQPGSEGEWGVRVADVRVQNVSATLNAYITHDAYGIFALQLRHGAAPKTSTSWLIFERRDPGPGGRIWTIESPTGEHATVLSTTPLRVRLRPTPAANQSARATALPTIGKAQPCVRNTTATGVAKKTQ